MRMMGILLLICFAILALPYLIRERLCHVLPLYATTATGRKLFDRQFQALVACCGFVGIVQFGIYVLVYGIKGLAVFWKGDCIDDTGLQLWCKNLPFGFYMLLYMLLVFVFVLAAVVLIYLIGRTAGNYIAGIAFAIPACAGIGFLLIHIFVHLFQKPMDENSLPYSEVLWILGWILACACVLWWKNAQGSLQRSLTIDECKGEKECAFCKKECGKCLRHPFLWIVCITFGLFQFLSIYTYVGNAGMRKELRQMHVAVTDEETASPEYESAYADYKKDLWRNV